MSFKPASPDLDYRKLERELDKTKTRVFLGTNAAFLGPLMASLNFLWTEDLPTAATDGLRIWWNPEFFLTRTPEMRLTVLLHELWHVALLHMVRRGNRDPLIWNYAGDYVINNMLDLEGYRFEGDVQPLIDHKYDGWTTEDVYDDLYQQATKVPTNYIGDLIESDDPGLQGQISRSVTNNVVSAVHSASLGGQKPGNLPGEIELTLKKFLSPKLPWEQILHNFFNNLSNQDYSWARPNRRYQDMYLPSMMNDHQGLEHLIYYLDVSGSISDTDIIRFHSEFKYVKDTYQPEKMTMVQFDTKIQKEDVIEKDDPFEETHVIGRGGTSLACVREHMLEHNPTAVVIFSDMWVEPMEPIPLSQRVPIIWVALNNTGATVPHGQLIHLNE